MNGSQRETIDMLKDGIEDVVRRGGARCRLCNRWFSGDSFGRILLKLGIHGEREHPEVVGDAGHNRSKGEGTMNGSEHDPWYCSVCERDVMPQSNSPGESSREWEERIRIGMCRSCWTKHKNLGTELSARLASELERKKRMIRVLVIFNLVGWCTVVAMVVWSM